MPSRIETDIAALSEIARILIDGTIRYRRASSFARDEKAAGVIDTTTLERRMLCRDVLDQVRLLGGDPERCAIRYGARPEIAFPTAATNDPHTNTAIAELELSDDYLRDEIHKLLERRDLSPHVRSFLARAEDRLAEGRQRISSLKYNIN